MRKHAGGPDRTSLDKLPKPELLKLLACWLLEKQKASPDKSNEKFYCQPLGQGERNSFNLH